MAIQFPLVVVNFKAYKEAIGKEAVRLAKICERVAKTIQINIAVAVQNPDIYKVSRAVSIPVFSQHIDPIEYGACTGHTLPEVIKENGAYGVLINHSEHNIRTQKIKKTIKRAKELNLVTVVCAPNVKMVSEIAKFSPDIIAIEIPGLIGDNISISKAKPEVILDSLKRVGEIPLLCGAGIKTREDVRVAFTLGTKGILISSGVTKAKNPEDVLTDLSKGFYTSFIPKENMIYDKD